MSNPSGIVKRIPLIKFPNRKAGQTQGRPQGGAKGASLVSGGSASTQPPRIKVSKEEIEIILVTISLTSHFSVPELWQTFNFQHFF
ncbi:hypothetical protein CY35_02G081900 [Sphagnum magellanicum]|nr:hypothetical protein CY35_02G081900 [Sphagnum magellanicum]